MPLMKLGLAALAIVSCLWLSSLLLSGCSAKSAQEFDAVLTSILNDANAGKTAAQMASDVCTDLGGSALTDAVCAGAENLVQSGLQYLLDLGVLTSQGKTTALAIRTGVKKPPATP